MYGRLSGLERGGETETKHVSGLYTQVAGVKRRFLSAPATSVQGE